MAPLVVEVITYAPTEFYHCAHCELVWRDAGLGRKIHAEQRRTALPDDLADQYAALSTWAMDLVARYGDRVRLRVIDAASVEGFFKSIRHGIRRYPAFIIGAEKYAGTDWERLTHLVAAHLDGSTMVESEKAG